MLCQTFTNTIWDNMPEISLIIVDNLQHDLAKFSIEKTIQHIDPKEIIIFSDRNFYEGSKFVNIKKNISIFDYSEIILKHLWLYLETDYALIIQWDGMATDRMLWSDEYLNYDYIGAPWDGNDQYRVGNGGFSLRSKKLIDALRDTEIQLGRQSRELEDAAICREYRQLLEQKYSITYAPYDIAKNFSFELNFTGNTFGFHGIWNTAKFFSEKELDYIIDNMPVYIWKTEWKYRRLLQELSQRGFKSLISKCMSMINNI